MPTQSKKTGREAFVELGASLANAPMAVELLTKEQAQDIANAILEHFGIVGESDPEDDIPF